MAPPGNPAEIGSQVAVPASRTEFAASMPYAIGKRSPWQVHALDKTGSGSDRKSLGHELLAARILCHGGSMVRWAGAGRLLKSWGLVARG
jgi:hypothetical protein